MNPWKIIGWIVLGLMVAFLMLAFVFMATCSKVVSDQRKDKKLAQTEYVAAPSKPSYRVHIINVSCQARRVKVIVKNLSRIEIPFAKAFFQAEDKNGKVIDTADSYFHPTTIPAGATASADSYFSHANYSACSVSAIQDRDGNAAVSSTP